MKIKDLLRQAQKKLKNNSPSPQLDSEILLGFVLKKDREFILANPDKEVYQKQAKNFEKLIEKRLNQEPVAYLIGEKFFYGRKFQINKNVLIPRPESEILIEKTLEYGYKNLYPSKNTFIWDIGTGSGCLISTLYKEFLKNPNFFNFNFSGFDISSSALEIAQKNAENLNCKVEFQKANLLDFVDKSYSPVFSKTYQNKTTAPEKYSNNLKSSEASRGKEKLKNAQLVVVANLPYLSKEVYQQSPASVIDFEPRKALLAEKHGLDLYLKLLEQIKDKEINQQVFSLYLILEISPEQRFIAEKKFKKIFPKAHYHFGKDLAGKWRFVEIMV
jgi:release factor glutamine methyltransferase